MLITVIQGSPKGPAGITQQYIKYGESRFPEIDFATIYVAAEIRRIETEKDYFRKIIDQISRSDGIIWATPVYASLVPSQMKRFIELIFENNVTEAFAKKYTAVLTTSAHFFDLSSAYYLNGISDDLKMAYAGEYLAAMGDLKVAAERKNLGHFFEYFITAIQEKRPMARNFPAIQTSAYHYSPPKTEGQTDGQASGAVNPKEPRKVILLTDAYHPDSNLGRMIDYFQRQAPFPVKIIDLSKSRLNGCRGCLNCVFDNQCGYQDDLRRIYEEDVFTAEAVIIAGAIKDRYLSALWKSFLDRGFVYGHVPKFHNQPLGFIVSGPLSQIPSLKIILENLVQMGSNYNLGTVTDESESSETISALLTTLALKLQWSVENQVRQPIAFLGLSSHLIFRDLVYRTRGLLRADHGYYQKNHCYDYPQRDLSNQFKQRLLALIMKVSPIRRKIQSTLNSIVIKMYTGGTIDPAPGKEATGARSNI